MTRHHPRRERWQSVDPAFRSRIFDDEVLPFHPPEVVQATTEGFEVGGASGHLREVAHASRTDRRLALGPGRGRGETTEEEQDGGGERGQRLARHGSTSAS